MYERFVGLVQCYTLRNVTQDVNQLVTFCTEACMPALTTTQTIDMHKRSHLSVELQCVYLKLCKLTLLKAH